MTAAMLQQVQVQVLEQKLCQLGKQLASLQSKALLDLNLAGRERWAVAIAWSERLMTALEERRLERLQKSQAKLIMLPPVD